MRLGYPTRCARARDRHSADSEKSDVQGAKPFVTGVAVGGTIMYLLDPVHGHRRRRALLDRAGAAGRRGSRRATRALRVALLRREGQAKGLVHRLRPTAQEPPDDVTLVDKVKSVVFRDPRFPKGQISINAEEGKVVLRGQVDQPELIADLEAAVRDVQGVRDVENLLHVPGTPAPPSQGERHAD